MSQLNQTPTENFADATPIPQVDKVCPCVEEVKKRHANKSATVSDEDYCEYEKLPSFEPKSKDGRNPNFPKRLGKNSGLRHNHNINRNHKNNNSLEIER